MKKTVALLIIGLTLFSCEKDEITDSCKKDEITDSRKIISESIDLNSDNKPDFKIIFFELATTDIPSSAGETFRKITPIDGNSILYGGNDGYLFLQEGDVIKKEASGNYKWFSYGANLISKKRKGQIYDEFWTVLSGSNANYYLGIKIKEGENEKIGWVKLDFDILTGEIYLLNSKISSSDELIIHE